MAIDVRDITGLVLAGGRGSRMGGVDKGLQRHGGETLAELARRRLAPQVGTVAMNANRHLDIYRAMSEHVWPDDPPEFAGPLAGIMAGLTRATTPYLATVPCDSPLFPHDLVARLADAMAAEGASIAMAFTRERGARQGQPVFCLMKTGVREHLAAAMRGGQRKIMQWARELPLAEVVFDDASAFANVNTLAELAALPRGGEHDGDHDHDDEHDHDHDSGADIDQAIDDDTTSLTTLASIAAGLAGYDASSLHLDVARAFLARFATRIDGVEPVPLRQSLGRVLANDVVSTIDVPPHDNAAMDGYALRHTDLTALKNVTPAATASRDARFAIVGRSEAGDAYRGAVGPFECVRIMTGAVMPDGLDTVVPQELVTATPTAITFPAHAVRAGDHRRRAGEDLARGGTALRAGRTLKPADLGLLASLGHAGVAVRRHLTVAIVTTGSELRTAGDPLDAGAVYDSNRFTLAAMLERIGVEVLDLGTVRDEPHALKAALRAAADQADVVITSGGVSVGEADHTRTVIAELGEVLSWGLAMRPGRPMAIGRIASKARASSTSTSPSASSSRPRDTLLFGLPGNPVAVMVTFYALVRDALLAMAGSVEPPRLAWRAISSEAIRKRPGRTEFLRGIVSMDADGHAHVRLTGAQGSGILRSMSEANALVVLAHERGDVATGEVVDVWPFDGLV